MELLRFVLFIGVVGCDVIQSRNQLGIDSWKLEPLYQRLYNCKAKLSYRKRNSAHSISHNKLPSQESE
jgi:hypothetical protein